MENSGQMVSFYLAKEIFGIELAYVQEIIRLPEMVQVPGAPGYFAGLANLRGSLLPVISGRARFGLPDGEATEATRVVVLDYRGEKLGFIVDRMSEVVNLEEAVIENLDSSGNGCGLLKKVAKLNEGKKIVLLIDAVALFPQLSEGEEGASRQVVMDAGQQKDTLVASEELQQFVGFKLAEEEYAVNIELVQEIVWVPEYISRSPGLAHYMDGLFSLRSRTVPMLNLRRYFGLPDEPYGERARVIVLNVGRNNRKSVFGLGVDAVSEVLRFQTEEIEPLPELLRGEATRNLSGVCKIGGSGRLIYLLDALSILEENDVSLEQHEQEAEQESSERRLAEEQQFVVFHLAKEAYALPIMQVKEIIRVPEIVGVPGAPYFIAGVINIRGSVLPVINLRRKLGLPEKEDDEGTRIVVVETNAGPTGLIVDAVREVRKISVSLIAETPAVLRAQVATRYLRGVVRTKEKEQLILLLDLEHILSAEEQKAVAEVLEEASVNTVPDADKNA